MKLRVVRSTGKKVSKKSKKSQQGSKTPRPAFSVKRHLIPPMAGVLAVLAVLAVLNGQYLVAQYHYRFSQKTVDTVVAPAASGDNTQTAPTPSPHPERDPYLTISSIGVEAPIVFESSTAEWKVQLGLREGVVHYGSTVKPGQVGNMIILGHSSGQPWAPGDYKFIFTLLNKVKQGDLVAVDYQGVRYIYKVIESFVVSPTETSVLNPTTKPTLTLITCTPVGSSANRLIVRAELVSPAATSDGQSQSAAKPQTLPGN